MITKEEFEKAVNYCTEFTVSCKGCPLNGKDLVCGAYFTEYIRNRACTCGNRHKLDEKRKHFSN